MQTARASTRSSSPSSCPRFSVQRPPQTVRCPDFNLSETLRSGQVFRWIERSPGSFSGWIGSNPVEISQRDLQLTFHGTTSEGVEHFFSLDLDLAVMAGRIDVDEVIHSALGRHWGLRVVRQDPWECLASFILSSYNNIPRLCGMLDCLARQFGSGRVAFPTPEALTQISERALRACGLGYRAPYLRKAAERVASGRADLGGWRELEDDALREKLLAIPGVGEKVVECVMLFAYGRTSAFPVDVWIGRAMRRWYFRGRKVTDRRIREFARRHFGAFCGWAQQYLYCAARAANRAG